MCCLWIRKFLIPNNFVDGGATGISLLIAGETKIPLYIILTVINIPFMIMGSKIIGRSFAIKTSFAIVGLSLAVAFVHFPHVTNEKVLVALFGGFFWEQVSVYRLGVARY